MQMADLNYNKDQISRMAGDIFKQWLDSVSNLESAPEVERRELFFKAASWAFEAAEEFSNAQFSR